MAEDPFDPRLSAPLTEREGLRKSRVGGWRILFTADRAAKVMYVLTRGAVDVFSAGTKPTTVRAEAVAALRECGIDISQQRSKSVDGFAGQEFDFVITVCDPANEACPVFPGKTQRVHWSFDDPAAVSGSQEERMAVFRRIRDQIQARLTAFVEEVGLR